MTTVYSPPGARRRDPILRWSIPPLGTLGDIQVEWMHATRDVWVHWGDSSPRELLGLKEKKPHTYDKIGAYKLRIRQSGATNELLAEAQVIIRDHVPAVTITRDPDNPGVVIATAPSTLDTTGIIPRYRIEWSYGRDRAALWDDWWGMPGASVRREMNPGTHTARITDLGTLWRTDVQYTIPEPTLAAEVTVTGRTATLTVTTAEPGKDLVVGWGALTSTEPVTGGTAAHTYADGGDIVQLVQLAYTDASETIVKDITLGSAA